jgi:cytochrome c-type biogenesis protein CcmH
VKRSFIALALALVLAGLIFGGAQADSVDDEARRIGRELQCPVCQGLPVADSPSQLAGQMRGIIRDKLAAGESRESILAYFSDRYGEPVLMTPPRSGLALAIWLAPVVGGLGALALVLWIVRHRRSTPPVSERADPALDPFLAEVDRASEAMRSQPLR